MTRLKASLDEDYLNSPYKSKQEPLSRYDLANRLTNLFKNLDHGTVSILNGRWGSGKSTFAKKFVHHLRADGISVTYFDAFANDYTDNPFLALSAHIFREIDERGTGKLKTSKSFREKSGKVANKLGVVSAKVLVKAATLGVLTNADLEELSTVADDVAEASGEVAETAIEAFSKIEDEVAAFRESLDGLAEALAVESGGDGEGKTVVIIDELDRCRPDFALGILETIKHMFDRRSVHFILVTNIDYLVASVHAEYGLGKASSEYLEKFYDFIVFFEQEAAYSDDHRSAQLVRARLEALLPERRNQEFHDLQSYLADFARTFDLSLRQASALATNAALAFLSYRENSFRPAMFIALLALYRSRYPAIYQSIKRRTYTMQEMLSVFEGVTIRNERTTDRIKDAIAFFSAEDHEIDRDDDRFSGWRDTGWRYNFGEWRDVFPFLVNEVLDSFGDAGTG